MRGLIKRLSILISVCIIALFAICLTNNNGGNNSIDAPVRNVELVENDLDANSYFEKFDSCFTKIKDNYSTFEGISTFKISDFADIDNVDYSNVVDTATLKFSSSFDYNSGILTLNVFFVDEEVVSIVDTIYGMALLADTGEVDVAFDFDGELILLSELRNCGKVDNIGWFKKTIKKAVNTVVSTAESAVKVLSTSNGAIGTVCTLAACAGVGALCAFIPGGQIVTTVCAGIAGSIVGGVGFQISAELAQKQNPDITEEDISNYKSLGAFIGSCVSVASCNAMTSYRAKRISLGQTNTIKKYDTFNEFKNDYGTANSYSVKYGQSSNGNFEWHHIVEQSQIGKGNVIAQDVYNIDNTISLGYDTHRTISNIYSTKIQNLGKYNIQGLENVFINTSSEQTVRAYLSTLSFDKQYSIGVEVLKLLGVIL